MTTTEPTIKSNEREALRLFERGVAAARGGQRRVAAGLLARAVQLNPKHEHGWLWLSGTLDKPEEIAFCLRTVLEINPQNERARQGLRWLEQRQQIAITPQEPSAQSVAEPARAAAPSSSELPWAQRIQRAATRLTPTVDPQAVIEQELQARVHGESWWVNFRRSRRDMGRVRVVLWLVPILLLGMTLALNQAMREAVERNEVLAREAATAAAIPITPGEVITIRSAEIVVAELPQSDDARVLNYLSTINPLRTTLRTAIEEYRAITSRPGGSSTTHAASARRLRDTIENAYTSIEQLTPPESLIQAHAYYLSGLETELAALDDMLTFYNSFSVVYANRAASRMAEADRYLTRARDLFEQRSTTISALTTAHTPR
jgi:hypothetical protein